MKLVCAQSDLSAKLSLLSRIVPSNPAHPVLANVLLTAIRGNEAESLADRLGLTVFDLSLGMQVWIPAQVAMDGAITLPARFLNDIVSRLPNTPIEITSEGLAATLTCASGHYQMQGIGAEEFPTLPEVENSEPMILPAATLVDGLQGSLFAASTDETKQVLAGLHLKTQVDQLEFAATDGHRLAVITSLDSVDSREIALTIPAKALRELERMLGRSSGADSRDGRWPVGDHRATGELTRSPGRSPEDNPGESLPTVALRFDPSQVIFEFATSQGPGRLSCRLLEGQYPNYRQLIPQQFIRQVTVERSLLLGALERIAVFAARKNNIVKLKLISVDQQLALSAEVPEFGSSEELLDAQVSGEDLEIAFNVKYMIDGLKAMSSTEVQLQFNSETTPATISPLGGRQMTYLIMPIQIRT